MKVLLTGATGFLGHYLVRYLCQAGYEVKAWIRNKDKLSGIKSCIAEYCTGNLEDSDAWLQNSRDCDFIIHAAANTSQKSSCFVDYEKDHVWPVKNLIKVAGQGHIQKIVYISTANCFQPGTKESPGNETKSIQKVFYKSGYIHSKCKAQKLLLCSKKEVLDKMIILNPAFIIGNFEETSGPARLFKQLNHRIILCPEGGKSLVSAVDVSRFTIHALQSSVSGRAFILAESCYSFREMAKIYKAISGRKSWIVPLPGKLLKIFGLLGDLWENISQKPASLNSINAFLLSTGFYYSGSKASEIFNIPYTPARKVFEDALKDYLQKQKKFK